MPCRDYESDNGYSQREEYKAQCDKLARIACAVMEELVKQGREDFLVLKNPEVAQWWTAHVKADKAEKARIAEKERKERVKAEALARLTDEEKELLGLAPKLKKSHKKHSSSYIYDEPVEYDIESMKEELDSFQKYSENDVQYLYKILRKNNL